MSITEETMTALVEAQLAYDRLLWEIRVKNLVMTPSNLRGDEVTGWRAQQLSPAHNPEVRAVLSQRDACLAETGLALSDWEKHWAKAQGK